MSGSIQTIQTPGQLIVLAQDANGRVFADPELPFRLYVGLPDAPGSETPEIAHLRIRNDTGAPISVKFVQRFAAGASPTDTPLEPTPTLSLAVGASDSLRITPKKTYRQWLAPLRPAYRRHRIVYFLHVTLTDTTSKECEIYGDIDPELIVEGRP